MRNDHTRLFIGGRWIAPTGPETIPVISPHTEQTIGRAPACRPKDVDAAVDAARHAFDHGPWPRMEPVERAQALDRLANLYEMHLEEFASVITTEMGSPITFSRANQAPEPLKMLRYYADLAETYPWETRREGDGGPVEVWQEPVGVAALVLPWNVPQWTLMTKLVPALLAGCTVVVKPAPETPLDAYLLAHLVRKADLPPGVVNIVTGGRTIGEYLVNRPGVDKVAFSGSTAVGRRIAELCGRNLKRCSVELGGKSAAIILSDADLDATMLGLKGAALMNNGQACAAQTRILAPRSRYGEVVDALAGMVSSLKVGDPMDPDTDIGPLVSKRQRSRVEYFLHTAVIDGARLVVGGPDGYDRPGWYVRPTVFADVGSHADIAQQEVFGPVLTVTPYDTTAHAVQLANDSRYGLAGSVWTADPVHGEFLARQIRTGTFGINCYRTEACAPFGGVKDSGLGRELGPEGLAAYLEPKAILHR